MSPINWARLESRAKFSADEIAKAVEAAQALPSRKGKANKVGALWPMADPMPTLANLDFRQLTNGTVNLDTLQASDDSMKRDNLIWHIQNPGEAKNKNPFTTAPIVMNMDDGSQVIVDGHHRLSALKLLGASTAAATIVPAKD